MGKSHRKKSSDNGEALLVKRAKAGDRQAYEALVAEYASRILHYLYRFVGDFHEAEDLTQEAFTKAYRGIGDFELGTSFKTWL